MAEPISYKKYSCTGNFALVKGIKAKETEKEAKACSEAGNTYDQACIKAEAASPADKQVALQAVQAQFVNYIQACYVQ